MSALIWNLGCRIFLPWEYKKINGFVTPSILSLTFARRCFKNLAMLEQIQYKKDSIHYSVKNGFSFEIAALFPHRIDGVKALEFPDWNFPLLNGVVIILS